MLECFKAIKNMENLKLEREKHLKYLKKSLQPLPTPYQSLDPSKPWICYWVMNAMALLNYRPDEKTIDQ